MNAAAKFELSGTAGAMPVSSIGTGEQQVADLTRERPIPIRYLFELADDELRKPLRRPLMLKIESDGSYFTAFVPTLSIGASGRSVEEAMAHVSRAVLAAWREASSATPRGLHASAIAQAIQLRALFAR